VEKKKPVLKKSVKIALMSSLAVIVVASICCLASGADIMDIFRTKDEYGRITGMDLSGNGNTYDTGNSNSDSPETGTAASNNGTIARTMHEPAEGNVNEPAKENTNELPEDAALAANAHETQLKLNIKDFTIVKGFKIRVVPEILPSAADENVVWTSSNNKIASADKDGNITGLEAGSAVIACEAASGGKMNTVNVTVIDLSDEGATGNDDAYKDKYIPKLASKEFTVAEKDVDISNEMVRIIIPQGFIYPNRIQEYVLKWMKLVEKASGFNFYPEGGNHSKVSVTVGKGTGATGFIDGIEVAQMDLLTDDSATAYVFLHELSHTLDDRNSDTNMTTFKEGFAILNACGAMKLLGRSDLAQVTAYNNFWAYPAIDSQLDNFEEYYTTVDGWDAYNAGYKFAFYLQQKYGDRIFTGIMKKWRSISGANPDEKQESNFIKVIKECTSENVFSDFKDWYLENKALYNKENTLDNDLYSAAGITEAMCLPVINEDYQGFPRYKYGKVDYLLLDFYEALFLSQYYGYSARGIFGKCYTSTEATVSFYDPEWKFICSKKLDAGLIKNIEVWGAARMLVKGSGGYFNFDPSFEKMMEKSGR
jgi:hypothetical protein